MLKEAKLVRPLKNQAVQCRVCEHYCTLHPGDWGKCGVRVNRDGRIYLAVYGSAVAAHVDPIEKKPLFHFLPGSRVFSIGTYGCNLRCAWCQNWQISQQEAPFRELTPEQALALARHYRADGSIGLAYTYNEPTLSYEFIIQTARLVHKAGLVNVMVSNGYIEKEPLQALLPYIDAWNIDLKGFSQDFYQSLCGASLQPVLDTIEAAAAVSHVEVTTLVIPGENDDPAQMDAEARWLASILPDIPLHLTRYFPQYHWSAPVTPVETLKKLQAAAIPYLHYVYLGNV